MSVDCSTRYLGLQLRSPLVVAACPLTSELDVLQTLVEHGAAAAVLPSLFEEQICPPHPTGAGANRFQGVSPFYFHELMHYNKGPEAYLDYIQRAKAAVSIPIIASLNGSTKGGWLGFAQRIEAAGADALELNLMHLPVDPAVTADDVEKRYIDAVSVVRAGVRLPLSVKIGPYFSALPNFAHRLVDAGANGLVLFHRYLQPSLSLNSRQVMPHLTFSKSDELRLTLRWIAILSGRIDCSLAASTGVHSATDMLKAIAVGADVVQVASVIYRRGVQALIDMQEGVESWLGANDYPSTDSLRGVMSHKNCPDPAALLRANYVKTISSVLDESDHESPELAPVAPNRPH